MHHVDDHRGHHIPAFSRSIGERSRTAGERSPDGADHFEQLREHTRRASALCTEELEQEHCAAQHSAPKHSFRHDEIPRQSAPGPQSAPSDPPDVDPPDVEPPDVDPPDVEPPGVVFPLLPPGSFGVVTEPPDGGAPRPGAVAEPLSQVVDVSRSVLS